MINVYNATHQRMKCSYMQKRERERERKHIWKIRFFFLFLPFSHTRIFITFLLHSCKIFFKSFVGFAWHCNKSKRFKKGFKTINKKGFKKIRFPGNFQSIIYLLISFVVLECVPHIFFQIEYSLLISPYVKEYYQV